MNLLGIAALGRWLDPPLWQALAQAQAVETTLCAWSDLLPQLAPQADGCRWVLPQRLAEQTAARAADPAGCQFWHLRFYEALCACQEMAEAVYHLEQAGNLCLARQAYDELDRLIAALRTQPLALDRFDHLLTYYEAVLAVERHAWDAASALLDALRRRPTLDADLHARAANTLGVQAYHQGQYDASLRFYAEAQQTFQRLGDGVGQARTGINMAIVLNLLGQFDDAIACLQTALASARASQERVWESWILNELGINYKDLARWDEAQAYLEQALATARTLGRQRGIATALANLGELFLLLGRAGEAERYYQEALQQTGAPFLTIEVLGNLGLLRQMQGQQPAAADLFEQALAHAREIHSFSYQALAHYRLGALARHMGDLTAARAQFEQAIHLIEALRSQIAAEDVRIHLFGGWQQVYSALFLLALEQGDPAAALTYAERARARAFLDLVCARAPEAAALGEPLEAAQIQARLPDDWLLLTYFDTHVPARFQPVADWLARRQPQLHRLLFPAAMTTLLAVAKETIEAHPLALDAVTALRRTFSADGRTLAGLLPGSDGRLTQPWALRSLGILLLAPVQPRLAQARHVVITPHGPLHYVPFSALCQADGASCWRPDCALQLAPSASVLLTPQRRQNGRALAHELANDAPALVMGFAPDLRHAEAEAHTVAALLHGHLLLGAQATQEAFLTAAPTAPLIHLSCHGVFDRQRPLQSGLQLADGTLTAATLLNRPPFLRAALATLSACESGRSGVLSGDELLGLVRGVLAAGAGATLVSLWAVDELSTRLLMRFFYERLAAGVRPAAALHQAQALLRGLNEGALQQALAIAGASPTQISEELARLSQACAGLSDGDHLLSHPYYWAGFVLVSGEVSNG